MAIVYSTQFFTGLLAAAAKSPTITVPASTTFILRHIAYRATYAAANELLIRRLSDDYIFMGITPAANALNTSWEGRLVLPTGTAFYIEPLTTQAQITVSGYSLPG